MSGIGRGDDYFSSAWRYVAGIGAGHSVNIDPSHQGLANQMVRDAFPKEGFGDRRSSSHLGERKLQQEPPGTKAVVPLQKAGGKHH